MPINIHVPVLLKEVIRYLQPHPNQNFIDCTVGEGGHAEEILKRTAPKGFLLAIDLDPQALSVCKRRLAKYKSRCIFVEENFINLTKIINEYNFGPISGILFDLGISSYQLQDFRRGFAYKADGILDMRFGKGELLASEIVNEWKEKELTNIFRRYGELLNAKRIAREIVKARKRRYLDTTQKLTEAVLAAIPDKRKKESILSRIFQSIRIAVNQELKNLERALISAIRALDPGGRLACISYHSLEDRIVKRFFVRESKNCICPPQTPVCVCRHRASLKIITKKPVIPTEEELKKNPRSRSAKLRVAEKIEIKR